jgi:glycosyltransferase involved in cell wall biosynthesis
MNVLMVTLGRFPPDVRIEKEIRALQSAGHNIHIACTSGDDRHRDSWEGSQIHRLDPPRPSNVLLRKLNSAVWTALFIDLFWFLSLQRIVKRNRIELLHVHDLPLVRTARRVARLSGCSIVADLHENYPEALEFYTPRSSRNLVTKFRYARGRWLRYEHKDISACDSAIAVSPEMKTRLMLNGVPESKIRVVENTVDLENWQQVSETSSSHAGRLQNAFVICYAGSFGLHRGLDTAIRAMPRVRAAIPTAKLLLVGDGRSRSLLESLVSELDLDGTVEFTGWVDRDTYNRLIGLSEICLLPLLSNPHTEAGLPNKLFEYMSQGKPVVVSSCKGLSRIVRETGAGLEFRAGDQASLAETILELTDEETRRRIGDRGRAAVLEEFNWKQTSKKLLTIYDELATKHRGLVEAA